MVRVWDRVRDRVPVRGSLSACAAISARPAASSAFRATTASASAAAARAAAASLLPFSASASASALAAAAFRRSRLAWLG